MSKNIILIGGGGHCKSAIELIRSSGKYQVAGIVDLAVHLGKHVMDIPVIGTDDDIPSLRNQYDTFLVTVGQIRNHKIRQRLYEQLVALDANLPVIIAPSAFVAPSAQIGAGTLVFHQAVVNAEAVVGANCIINNMALVEHECEVGDHCHISTAAVLNGNVFIGAGSFIGSNACVRNGVSIGEGVVVGAGSLVLRDVENGCTIAGIPAINLK